MSAPRKYKLKNRKGWVVVWKEAVHGVLKRRQREFSVEAEAAAFFQEKAKLFPVLGAAGLGMDAMARDEYWAAKALLPEGVSLADAARFFVQANPSGLSKEVWPLLQEFLLYKERRDGSARTSGARKQRLESFVKGSGIVFVGDLVSDRIDAWLWRSKDGGGQVSRRGARSEASAIRTFCRWLLLRGLLPDNPVDRVDLGSLDSPEPVAMRVEEIERFLKMARISPQRLHVQRKPGGGARKLCRGPRARMVPFIAIGIFAGLRPSEIERLDKNCFSWGYDPFIRVKKIKRGRGVRLVPIEPCLAAWLQAYPPQFPLRLMDKEWDRIREWAGLRDSWKNDLMRDTYISARLGRGDKESDVARAAGTREDTIHTFYRDLMTPEEANAVFRVFPQSSLG